MKFFPLAVLCLSLGSCLPALGITPVDSYNNLVAGQDDPGFKDGAFEEARFSHPSGMVFDDTGARLFVADKDNHRIRVIYLDENNRVDSLAGTGKAGKEDGPLSKASFNLPSALAWISPGRLAVYDEGSGLLRLVDLQKDSVSTLGVSADGKPNGVKLEGVWNLAYRPEDDSLYFSQPEEHLLQKLNLKSQKISTVLSQDTRLNFPQALCAVGGKLYAASQGSSIVYELDLKANPVSLVEVGKGSQMVELTGSDGILYALQKGGVPLARVVPDYKPVSLATPWGFPVDNQNPGTPPFLYFDGLRTAGAAASPREPRKLFITANNSNSVISVKDYDFDKTWGARSVTQLGVLTDFDYPDSKPSKTFRILVVGNSRIMTAPAIVPGAENPGSGFDGDSQGRSSLRTNTFPKQLELILNTQAALDGMDTHFEVLMLGHPGLHLQFFGNGEVPDMARKYHIDLVLAFTSSFKVEGFKDYFEKPMTDEGIPSAKVDPEFLLKPWKDKIPPGAPARLFARCKERGWVQTPSPTRMEFPYFEGLMATGDEEVRNDLMEMIGRPFQLLAGKIRSLPDERKGYPRFLVCYAPSLDNGSLDGEVYHSFWRDLCARYQLDLLDLTGPFTALKISYYPTSEMCCHNHYTTYGNYLVATLLGYYLPEQKWVPWGPTQTGSGSSK